MREIATIIPDKEFNDYLGTVKEQIEGLKSPEGYMKRLRFIMEAVTVTAGKKEERVFTESQLKQLFFLANESIQDQITS